MLYNRNEKNIYVYTLEAQSDQERIFLEHLEFIFPPLNREGEQIWGTHFSKDKNGKVLENPEPLDRKHMLPIRVRS